MPFKEWTIELDDARIYIWRHTQAGKVIHSQGPTIELRAKNPTEPRSLVIGKIQEKYWTAIITRRHGMIRIISVRRTRNEEKNLYL